MHKIRSIFSASSTQLHYQQFIICVAVACCFCVSVHLSLLCSIENEIFWVKKKWIYWLVRFHSLSPCFIVSFSCCMHAIYLFERYVLNHNPVSFLFSLGLNAYYLNMCLLYTHSTRRWLKKKLWKLFIEFSLSSNTIGFCFRYFKHNIFQWLELIYPIYSTFR